MVGGDLTTGALVVFGLIAVALVLFVTEAIPNDITAIGIIVSLAALEPLTGIGPTDAISGFASTATITIVAMYMLSAGIQKTGLVQRLGIYLARFTRGDEKRALVATIASTGPIAGFINNTPVVAIFIPMISELADKIGVSPSKLLLPLSYAAILGGTLTLIGTSTNLLASEFAVELLGREAIGMFEFTALGAVVLLVGLAYLMTVGWWLTPARLPANADLVEEFDLEDHLSEVSVRQQSPAVGLTVGELEQRTEANIRILQLRRPMDEPIAPQDATGKADEPRPEPVASLESDDQFSQSAAVSSDIRTAQDKAHDQSASTSFFAVRTDQHIRAGDVLIVHGNLQAVNKFVENQGFRQLSRSPVTDETFDKSGSDDVLAKAVIPTGSSLAGKSIDETRFREVYGTTVLAIRREGKLLRTDLNDLRLASGDVLLIQTVPSSIKHLTDSNRLVILEEDAYDWLHGEDIEELAPLSKKTPLTLAIMAGVVGAAALNLVSIVIAALAGVFLMVVTGCLSTNDAYDAVSWNIIFLLAGVIPLGAALEETGGSQVIANVLVAAEAIAPLVVVLLLFYIVTGLLANVITPVATVVLMIPVAVDAAASLGASQFSFLLAVMFASATSFMTPVGYQTNLMVYSPGGYEFTDFVKVGGPLQFLLAVVTTLGIVFIWGI